MGKVRTLVIDTNVFRAAGETQAPVSTAARELLETLLAHAHHVAWCDELDKEFWKHRSKFSSGWKTAMEKRGRVASHKIDDPLVLPYSACEFSSDDQEAAEKDRFLLDLARKVDRLIASFELRAPALFRRLAAKNKKIQKLGWAHPAHHQSDLTNWLTRTKFSWPESWYLKS